MSPDYQPSFQFPWNPDPLVEGNNYRIYDEMRDDDQVKIAIALKKDMVVNTGWDIKCDDDEARDFIIENLRNIHTGKTLDSTFEDVLRDILTSYEYGFSISEVVYRLSDASLYEVAAIKVRPPHTFKFDLDTRGDVKKVVQTGDMGDLDFKPDKFLHHVYQQEFGNPYGKSDLKAAHTAWRIKKHVQKFLAVYTERFASPTVVGRFDDTMESTEITKIHNVIKSIQNVSSIVIPKSVEIDFKQPMKDGSDTYIKALDFFNLMIARAILVPDLLGVGGSKTSGGSFSLGEKQFELFLSTINKDRESLARKVTQRIIRPMVMANWGEMPCEFEFAPFSEQDELEMSKLWSEVVKGKVYKPTDDEVNHFRRSVKFPEGPVEITEPVEPMPEDNLPFASHETTHKFALLRQLTSFEKKMNFTSIQRVLSASDKGITPDLESVTSQMIDGFLNNVMRRNVITNFRPELIETIDFPFKKVMQTTFKNHFRGLFRFAQEEAQKELFPQTTKKKFVADDVLPDEFEDTINAEAFRVVGDYIGKMSTISKNILLKGIRDGLSEGELVRLLKEQMKNKTELFISSVVRTTTTEIFNSARKTFWDTDPFAKQIIEAFQYSAIIDSRTSDVCAFLDGKIFLKGELTNRITPPLHPFCRSLLVPVTRFEDFESDKGFVPRKKEPSIESLKKKGGSLILGQ